MSLKKNYLLPVVLILPLIFCPGIMTDGLAQVTDTNITTDELYKSEEPAGPDSIQIHGEQMINDAEQADKILNESI
ncbi:MAG: hypothetical protein HGA23_05885, partial [Bacteroidales bacterium]|nr:hypothetical protein [Bacteroidales bacterium]